jgi:serine/threonine-protein kinase RsbW
VSSEKNQPIYSIQFELTASYDQLSSLKLELETLFRHADWIEDKANIIYQVRLAIHETCTNIIEHAYQGQPGLIRIVLTLQKFPLGLLVDLYDQGNSFDIEEVASPDLSMANNRGYGLFLIRQLMDEVIYEPQPGGNHWQLYKNLPAIPDRGNADL